MFFSKKHVSACLQREEKAKGALAYDKYEDQCLSRLVPAPSPTPPRPGVTLVTLTFPAPALSHIESAVSDFGCSGRWQKNLKLRLLNLELKFCLLKNLPGIVASRLQPLIGCVEVSARLPVSKLTKRREQTSFHSRLSKQVCVVTVKLLLIDRGSFSYFATLA